MGAGTLEFGGYIYNGAGSPVVGAALSLFPRNTTCSATTTTTTNCSGYWTMSTTTQNQYDVRISDCCATIIRYLKYDDAIQVKSVEALQFRMRSATGTSGFDYDIVPGSISAARTLNLPVITGTDTLATLGLAATYSAIMTHSADIIIQDASDLALGSGSDALFRWSTGDADNHSLVIATGNSNQALHITDVGAVATDWAIAATTHPNVYIHSNTTPATDYLRLGDHDGTTAYVDVVGGTTLALEIAGNTEATITASGLTLPANSDLIFTGGTGTNDSGLANGLADALSVTDGSADVLVIDTSTSGNVITASSAVTVGVDDTGHDVKFFGASAGAYLIYDQSEDRLEIRGPSADATTSTGKLLLSTALTDINANDVIGKIDFQAPLEAGGTDAITVAASIQAIAQGTFSASVNSTDLIFYTGHSEAATEKFRFTSQGELGIGGATYGSSGDVLTSGGAGAAPTWATPTTGDITGVTAGDGLSGGGTSGTVSLALDLNELTAAAVADGDFIPIIDTNDSNGPRKEAVHDLATLFAGAGMTATSSVMNVIGGDGITANSNDVAITAAQTTVTSVYNTSLKMGRDSQNLIDFATTDNKIILRVNNVDEVELVENALSPVTSDGVALGTGSLMWSDLFLASASVINFDNGDVTLTHASNTVTLAGGNLALTDASVQLDSGPTDETVSGITASFTAGETLVRGEVVYYKPGDSKMWKAVATAAATSRCVAMAAADISADAAGVFLLKGFLQDNASFPSYTAGDTLYTPEAEQNSENVPEAAAPDTDGDFVQIIGWAVDANTVYFDPDLTIVEVA